MIVTVNIIGGVGNQMFQYAMGRKVSIINNSTLKLFTGSFPSYDVHPYKLNELNVIHNEGPRSGSLIREHHYKYNPDMLKKYNEDVFLYGYWQSYKYFDDIRDILLKEFTPKTPIVLNKDKTTIGIHVRRGDYYTINKEVHGLDLSNYYKNAVEYMLNKYKDVQFLVFSDDINWCKNNLKVESTYMENNTIINDLSLMSQCDHIIMANSTFSWWASWLNTNPDKTICTPSKWVNGRENQDFIPPSWIVINV